MNIFFYSPNTTRCRRDCSYLTCPQRCLSILRGVDSLHEMVALHGNLHSALPFNVGLRSGDLMILFAASWYDLEQLIAMQDLFESFRVILILGDEKFRGEYRYHQLQPRFTASLETSLVEIESVINKMTSSTLQTC